jgi:hypothetical protein
MKRVAAAGCLLTLMVAMGGSAHAAAPATFTGSWKIAGVVQGIPVNVTCAMVQGADLKVTGACVDDQSKSHPMTGIVKDQQISWNYASEYEGTPIVITWTGTMDAAGASMKGSIAVDPFGVDGDFTATMSATPAPATTPAS